jgi:hypothetical protein
MLERRGVFWVLVGKPEGKMPLGRHRSRWENYIEMDLQEVVCGSRTGSSGISTGTGGGQL